MALVRLTVFWSTFLLLFVTSKALVTLATAECDESQLGEDQACFQIPSFKPVLPTLPVNFTFDPNYVEINQTAPNVTCSSWNLWCKALKSALTAAGTAKAILVGLFNVAIAVGEIGRILFHALLFLVNQAIMVFNTILFLVKLTYFMLSLTFTFVPGAPWYVNIPFVLPLIIGAVMVGVKIALAVLHGDNS